ncbi:MAG: RrF2 family transcriptional regulator [Flavobacteriales bacterium]|jgi:Rrf2 family protein
MLTMRTRYALRALIHISIKSGEGKPVSASSIAEGQGISFKFLEAILHDLKVSGYVISKKGIGGGYTLDKAPSDIRLADVIRTINGPIALVPCVSLNFYEACTICPDESKCALHHVMIEVRDATLQILESTSLEDLILREKKLVKRKG